jgi:hypothetical protein
LTVIIRHSAFDRRNAHTVPYVKSDHVYSVLRFSEKSCCSSRDKAMRRAVETVPSDAIFFIPSVGHSIYKNMGRDRSKERRVKDSNLRNTGHQIRDCPDAGEIDWIMQDSQFRKLLYGPYDSSIDQHRFCERLSTVHNAMTYRVDLREFLNDALFRSSKKPMSHSSASE